MRTTIDIPDELFRQVKVKAAQEGVKLKDLLTRYIEKGINGSTEPALRTRQKRSPLPVLFPATGRPIPSMTNAEIDTLLTLEDLQKIPRRGD